MITLGLARCYAFGLGGLLAAGYLGSLWLTLQRLPRVTPRRARLLLGFGVRTAGTAVLLAMLTRDGLDLVLAIAGFAGVRAYVLFRLTGQGLSWN